MKTITNKITIVENNYIKDNSPVISHTEHIIYHNDVETFRIKTLGKCAKQSPVEQFINDLWPLIDGRSYNTNSRSRNRRNISYDTDDSFSSRWIRRFKLFSLYFQRAKLRSQIFHLKLNLAYRKRLNSRAFGVTTRTDKSNY